MSERISTQNTRNILVAVDVQRDFVDGNLPVRSGAEVIAPLNKVAEAVRKAEGTVIFTRDWHPAHTPHFEKWPIHCVQGSDGAAFDPRLDVAEGDVIISKGMGTTDGYSAVEGVGDRGETLEGLIQPKSRAEHVRVFFGGLATDYCVLNSVLDTARTFKNDERVALYLLRDAVRAVNLQPGDGLDAIEAMSRAGVEAMTSDEVRRTFFGEV